MLLAILAIWFGYKKALDSGRNGVLWAFICGGAYIGVQLMVGLAIGAFLGIGIAAWGWPETIFDDYQILISIVSIVFAIATILIIFRYLDRIPDEPVEMKPPPPPTFSASE